MTDQSKFEVKFEKGDRLVHPRGATAEVLDVAKHKHDKGTVYGYRLRITQADGKVQETTVPLTQFTGKGWRLSMTAEEAAAQSPAEPVVQLISEPLDSDEQKIAEVVIAENEITSTVIAAEPDLAETARHINELTVEVARLQSRNVELLAEKQHAERRATLAEDNLSSFMNRAEAPTVGAAAPTAAPCKEFMIMTNLRTSDLERMDRDGWKVEYMQFAESGDLRAVYSRIVTKPAPEPVKATAKVVVPSAILEPAPVMASPAEVATAEADLIERSYNEAHEASPIDKLPRQSPPRPLFNARKYMQESITAALEKAAQAVAERQPIYDQIINRPTALPGVGGRVLATEGSVAVPGVRPS